MFRKKKEKVELSEEQISEKILLRQIKEAQRKEKLQNLYDQYKKQIISFVVILTVVLFGLAINYLRIQGLNQDYSKLMQQALIFEESNNKKESIKILEEIINSSSAPNNIKSLALIKFGSFSLDDNDVKKAVESYLKANEIKNSDLYLKELSALLALKTMVDSEDKQYFEKIENLIEKFEKEAVILKPSILEQKAIFYWLQNKPEEAKAIFNNLISNSQSPEFIKAKSREFIKIIERK